MAAIVSSVGQHGLNRTSRSSARKNRVARVSAKAAQRSSRRRGGGSGRDGDHEGDREALEDDAELTAEHADASDGATDGATESATESAVDRKRTDSATYLSMYFRDMAALDVLQPEQEFTSARELEALEIVLWEAVLAFAPAVEHVLAAIEPLATLPSEARMLRAGAARRGAPSDPRTWTKLTARAARRLRADDVDHLFIDAALGAIDRVALGIGSRGAPVGALGRERARKEWLLRVHTANRAAAAARNEFVKANLRLVVSIARRFNHGRMALADLIQEGNLGLMKAVERYDYRRGFRFSTYASWWIRHAISRALADKGREVRLPVHMIDAQHRLTKARRQLTGQLGRQPTTEELAAATQMPLDKVEKMRSWLLEQSISIDKPVGDDEGRVLGEVLEDPDREEVSPTGELEWEALTAEVRDLLHELRPIEADILRQRFGLGTEQELTLKEIGDKYNLSRERIRQLQEQALAKMRRALARRDLL
jgi:RNA polymerase primary sigma factor